MAPVYWQELRQASGWSVRARSSGECSVKLNVGCGLEIVPGYDNLDNSLSIRVQSSPWLRAGAGLVERMLQRQAYTRFPAGVRWCDVTHGLPYPDTSVEVVYSSHMLEHLPRQSAEWFVREAYRVLKPGGVLRIAVPDLERKARDYLVRLELDSRHENASAALPADEFMQSTLLGVETRWTWRHPGEMYRAILARGHLWMWDGPSLSGLLFGIGFGDVREKGFRESVISEIEQLDVEERRGESVYVEGQRLLCSFALGCLSCCSAAASLGMIGI